MGNIGSAFGGNSGNSGGGQLGSSDALRERRRNGIFPRTKKVDGGYLFPMNGLYSRGDKAKDLATSQEQLQEESEDFSYHLDLIQQFIVSRRLAPFYLGYNDEESIPTEKVTLFAGANDATALESKTVTDNASSSTTRPKSVSFNVSAANFIKSISSASGTLRRSGSFKQQGNPLNAETSSSDLAAETGKNPSHPTSPVSSHRNNHEDKVKPDYSDPVECPICFLLYPKNINYTRCCDHPICTECFIEIRRNTDDGSSACCPFCVRPEFGVYYNPPEKSRENDVSYDHRDYRASTLSLPISPTKKAQPSTSTVNVVVASGGRTSSVTSTSPSSIKRSNSELNMSAKVKKGSELPQQLIVTSDQIRPDFLKNFEKKQERERERSRLASEALNRQVNANLAANFLIQQRQLAFLQHQFGIDTSRLSARTRRRDVNSVTGFDASQEIPLYFSSLRDMNTDLEEMMLQEAIRQSMAEQEEAQRREAQQEASDVANIHIMIPENVGASQDANLAMLSGASGDVPVARLSIVERRPSDVSGNQENIEEDTNAETNEP